MEIKEIAKWSSLDTQELYFDKVFNFYIIKTQSAIYVQPFDGTLVIVLNLDKICETICLQPMIQLRICIQKSLIACVTEKNKFLFFNYQEFKQLKIDTKNERVLGFSFLGHNNFECAFFIVTSHRVLLYKIGRKKSTCKELRTYNVQVMEYSFEEKDGILAVVENSGKVRIYFLYHAKGSKGYTGPVCELFIEETERRPIFSSPKSQNLLKFVPRVDCNQMVIYKIYESPYLIHLDNLHGKLYLYKVGKQAVDLFTTLVISPGIFGIGISEHLIILQNYTIQETFFYDIHSHKNDYIIRVNHLEELSHLTRSRKSAEFVLKTQLNCEAFFISDAVTIDILSSSFKTVKISPADLIENHPDDQKIIFFLLRRDNCKQKVLEKLKDSLLTQACLKKLEVIFSTLAAAYAKNKEEKLLNKRLRGLSDSFQHLELTTTEIDPNDEWKADNNVTVITQSDFYYFVFNPVYKSTIDLKYLCESLYCYVFSFMQAGLKVNFSIQFLFFKLLIKLEEYVKIENLIENQCFSDSQDLALFLISVGKTEAIKKFPGCFAMGIDMLQRLKLRELMAQELCDQDYAYEGLEIHRLYPVSQNILSKLNRKYELSFYDE